jgi:uncharacterized protein (DUF2237 family)
MDRKAVALFAIPMAVVTILGWVGDALAPSLLDRAPLLLLVCNPRLRNLVLVSPLVDVTPFVLVAVGRLVISDPLFYWFGRRYGDTSIRWMERKLGPSAGTVLWAERLFRKAAWPVVALMPNNLICLLAARQAWRGPAAIVNVTGTLACSACAHRRRLDPILAFNAWIGRNRLVLTVITIGITLLLVARSARRGRDPVESPSELAAELDGMYKGDVAKNVLGTDLEPCGFEPLTGFYRDGCCNTGGDDPGVHVVCAQMTAEFLAFSRAQGNDLSTAVPEAGFPGLQPGDRWCLCASRWQEALDAGVAPPCTSMRPTSRPWNGARSTPCAATRSTNPVAPVPEASAPDGRFDAPASLNRVADHVTWVSKYLPRAARVFCGPGIDDGDSHGHTTHVLRQAPARTGKEGQSRRKA